MDTNIWSHTTTYLEQLTRRARNEDPPLTCEEQLLEILEPLTKPGMTVLDTGCATGYYYRTLKSLGIEYYGIDSCAKYIDAGKREMPNEGLPADRLRLMQLEDLCDEVYDLVVCFNTLLYCPNYHLPLERLAQATRSHLVLRTTLASDTVYRFEEDGYLDEGYNHLKAYFNIYSMEEIKSFIKDMGFIVTPIVDKRTGDKPEMVIGKVHPWRILLCTRQTPLSKEG